MVEVRHIMAATDGSPPSEKAFKQAQEWAAVLRAQLTICCVTEACAGEAGSTDDVARLEKEFIGRSEELERSARDAGVRRVRTILDSGVPYSRILHHAEVEDVDLLVLGATGWGRSGSNLGEVASQVVRYAKCSVVIVR